MNALLYAGDPLQKLQIKIIVFFGKDRVFFNLLCIFSHDNLVHIIMRPMCIVALLFKAQSPVADAIKK